MGYIKYKIYKNTNGTLGMQNKYYARAYHDQTITLEDLAEHMSLHNTVFTKGTIHGVLMDMVACVRELLLDSKKVKLDNLAIFSLGLQSKPADTLEEFSASTNIVKAYINALGTGEISKKQLDVDARFREVGEYARGVANSTGTPSEDTTPDEGNGGTSGGSSSGGSTSGGNPSGGNPSGGGSGNGEDALE